MAPETFNSFLYDFLQGVTHNVEGAGGSLGQRQAYLGAAETHQ